MKENNNHNSQNHPQTKQSIMQNKPMLSTNQQQQLQQIQQEIINQKKIKVLNQILKNKDKNRNIKNKDNIVRSNYLNINPVNNNGRQGGLQSCVSHPCDVAKLEYLHINPDNENQAQSYNQNRRNSTCLEDSTMILCRICFTKDLTLISPCMCKGSLKYVHEDCLVQWLQTSNRKKCELCQTPFYIYKGRSSFREFLIKLDKHFREDKSRCLRLIMYLVYLWLLKNRLFNLIRVYYNMVKQMKALWMLKALYNVFIVMLVFQLATEEYGRIKKIVNFIQQASIKYRVKGIKQIKKENI